MSDYQGECLCGQVKITARGEPLRVGICHCTDCRKESGSAFTFYGIWAEDRFESKGETSSFNDRRFCPFCGSRVFALYEGDAELKLGILEQAPTSLKPSYELWIKRREPWLKPVEGAEQYEQDRP